MKQTYRKIFIQVHEMLTSFTNTRPGLQKATKKTRTFHIPSEIRIWPFLNKKQAYQLLYHNAWYILRKGILPRSEVWGYSWPMLSQTLPLSNVASGTAILLRHAEAYTTVWPVHVTLKYLLQNCKPDFN